MLKKYAKSSYGRYIRSGAKIIIVVEAVIFVATYGVWHRMNTSRDFRLYMHNNYSWALNGYYKIGEKLSSDNVRQTDLSIWIQEGNISREP